MAKNKNRDRKPSQPERAPRRAEHSVMESPAEQPSPQVTPGDLARKGRQKRFGHN
ncbi:hypothetical protein AB0K92_19190 [Streptomyces sp. NPDC052687]|uniref:hypothetical protein n=1 Tax=Streptomyces sp. NPDC052687 TaxID=3154759 RepID=UPI0034471CFF